GTERHESRRIDNQLRGRSGRQGDPGETCFYVSLEDDLMRIFGGEQISNLMSFFKLPEDQALTHPMVSKAIEQAQVKVEGFNFDIRKHLVDYDDVLNKQREIIYTLRRKIVTGLDKGAEEFRNTVLEVFDEEIVDLVNTHYLMDTSMSDEIVAKFSQELNFILPVDQNEITKIIKKKDAEGVIVYLKNLVIEEFNKREKKMGKQLWVEVVRMVFLSTIDKYWMDHLTAIEDLREGINLRGYAQLDPLVEYKNEAFSMFERLVGEINYEVTRRLFKVEVGIAQEEPIKLYATTVTEKKPKLEKPTILKPVETNKLEYKSASSVDAFSQAKKPVEQNGEAKITVRKVGNGLKPFRTEVIDQGGFKIIPPGASNKKPDRNDPCWCNSGKKYKKCHYPN
ncbi:MAG: SEC-C metal-binding domain-containing protein, partial [bacterium]|nr:SEC-C metal-binding domain-containing protein [bacterium]